MLSTKKASPQMGLFTGLADQLDQKHSLYLLANRVDWPFFEDAFKKHYSEKMRGPAKPIRLMVSLLILKSFRNLSDENFIKTGNRLFIAITIGFGKLELNLFSGDDKDNPFKTF